MRKHDIYLNMKHLITMRADELTGQYKKSDQAYRRYNLNTLLDELIREIDNHYILKELISEKMGSLYKNWLTNYTIKRHER